MADNDQAFAVLKDFERALQQAPAAALESAKIALNEGAVFAEREARKRVHAKLNLDSDYIDRNLFLQTRASTADLAARIRAKQRTVLATRFGAKQATQPARSDRRYLKGDPGRGIPRGQKGAGSTPWSVLRGGNAVAWRNAFFVKLKGSGAWGMVARYGGGAGLSVGADWDKNLEVVHGMSVAQAWRREREAVAGEAMAIADRRFVEELEQRL